MTEPSVTTENIHLPRRIVIREVLESRYGPGVRPISWEERQPGVERVLTEDGEELALFSNGGQSSPAPGWELLLTRETRGEGVEGALEWTLYGIRP